MHLNQGRLINYRMGQSGSWPVFCNGVPLTKVWVFLASIYFIPLIYFQHAWVKNLRRNGACYSAWSIKRSQRFRPIIIRMKVLSMLQVVGWGRYYIGTCNCPTLIYWHFILFGLHTTAIKYKNIFFYRGCYTYEWNKVVSFVISYSFTVICMGKEAT
jgi:hypothetical protein